MTDALPSPVPARAAESAGQPVGEIAIFPLPAFADNYIWLLVRENRAVVVDPGDEAPVLAALEARKLHLEGVLLTHHHGDHVGGVAALVRRFPCPVFGPEAESITTVDHPLKGQESLTLLGARFQVWAVPGHTRGHLAYVLEGAGGPALFCGDTLFGAGCGRLFEGTPAQMAASLARIAALPPATRIYCAHEYTGRNLVFARAVEPDNSAILERQGAVQALGEGGEPTVPSTLALELATNPFLRCDAPGVIAAARAHGATGTDPVSVFTALRAWRNDF